MRRIDTIEDITEALSALVLADPRLAAVVEIAEEVTLRRNEPGFASLVSIIVSQQVSRASAQAMTKRLAALADPLIPGEIIRGGPDLLRAAGISRPKQRAILALADALERQAIDLETLCVLEPEEAISHLTALPGIGPWTAQIYLLFSAGHPDTFPARDVALQNAVGRAFSLTERPNERELHAMAELWSPWRGVAARLFWAYHHATSGRSVMPVLTPDEADRQRKTG